MNDIARLKSFDAERQNVDEMVALLTFGRSIKGTYADTGLVVPEWLDEVIGKIEQAIADRRRDELLRESKMLDMEERTLMTKRERREEVQARRDEINKLLGRRTANVEQPVPVTVNKSPIPEGGE